MQTLSYDHMPPITDNLFFNSTEWQTAKVSTINYFFNNRAGLAALCKQNLHAIAISCFWLPAAEEKTPFCCANWLSSPNAILCTHKKIKQKRKTGFASNYPMNDPQQLELVKKCARWRWGRVQTPKCMCRFVEYTVGNPWYVEFWIRMELYC